MGAGHVNPLRLTAAAGGPGLTFNLDLGQFRNFLAGQNLKRASKEFKGARLQAMPAYNLNRPIICVSRLKGKVTVSRRVTNVSGANSTYIATVAAPQGVAVAVSPSKFSIAAGASSSFTVTLTAKISGLAFSYGSIRWQDEAGHSVRMVLAVQPIKT
eukprot:TRINITY_DN27181_c0_g5_i1.p1 TRINITY_DN27181_c0_g5~~TRINITY_DN27181_c0_g5_i1.p1  ORF type:complete len:164 (-),score=4.93 TRINITY_DN27181_c0_g5_i1:387-857(-)